MLLLVTLGAASVVAIRHLGSISSVSSVPEHDHVICIDPGHPSAYSSGLRVQNGVTEMAINWEVASKLEALLRERPGLSVVKTRECRDEVMSNADRALVSNAAHADLFIRLHCDSGANHGFTVYYPDRQGTDLGITGPSAEVIEASRRAAYIVQAGMAGILGESLKDRGVRGEASTKVGRKQGALTGSIFSQAPTVTVEMVFLNNRYDAELIKSDAGQDQMARALANGVLSYLASLSKSDTVGSRGEPASTEPISQGQDSRTEDQ